MSFEAATTGVAGASLDGVRGVELTVGTLGVGVAFVVAFVVFWVGVAAPTAAWMAVLVWCSVTMPGGVVPPYIDYCWYAVYTVFLRDPISGRLAHVAFNGLHAGLRSRALNKRLYLFANGAIGRIEE